MTKRTFHFKAYSTIQFSWQMQRKGFLNCTVSSKGWPPLLLGELGKEKQSPGKDTTWRVQTGCSSVKNLPLARKKRVGVTQVQLPVLPESEWKHGMKCWWHTKRIQPLCPYSPTGTFPCITPETVASETGRKERTCWQSCGTFTPQAAMRLGGVREDRENSAWDTIKTKTGRRVLSFVHTQAQIFTTLFIQLPSHLAGQRLTEILQG